MATVYYEAWVIQDYCRDGRYFDMRLHYAVEDKPLGTAESVRLAREILDETFLVVSGDAVTNFELNRVVEFHRARDAAATLTLYRVENPLEYGAVVTDDDGRLLRFQETPTWGEVLSDRAANVPRAANRRRRCTMRSEAKPPEWWPPATVLSLKNIIALAKEHGLKIHEDPDLAQVLAELDLGSVIPLEIYQVVAEVLAYVYRANASADRLPAASSR